ncbi:MAG TPA: hypothetical protein VGP64_14505 [Polyangia bacterium]|jgi:hypothetical protein
MKVQSSKVWWAAALAVASLACSSSGKPKPFDGGMGGAGGESPTDAAVDRASTDGGTAAPTVVATLDGVPASLATDGTRLYVTVFETSAGHDGKVESVAKTAADVMPDAGTVTTLASGLLAPRAIAVNATTVFWADTDVAFPALPNVLAVSAAGGNATEVLSGVYTMTHLAISGSVLYGITSDSEIITAFSLSGADAGAGLTVYPGNPPNAVEGPDSDGTSVFFLTPGTTGQDLYRTTVGGTGLTDLVKNASSGSVNFDYILDDATSVFWSDAGTGSVFSVAKTAAAGATPKVLATINSGSAPVQLALDGDDIYLLWSQQLARIPKAGGTPVILASVSGAGSDKYLVAPSNAVALAVDASFVYWLHEGHSQILKMAK